MRIANEWQEFEIIDTTGGEKLERWGKFTLVRPDPQVIWQVDKTKEWKDADATYIRSVNGGGEWESNSLPKNGWSIAYKSLKFHIRPTNFKHTGLFPEQAVNWDFCSEAIKKAGRPINVLNLFAYTGGATLACAAAGASVCHVDASKGMVDWAKDNAALSSLSSKPIRWIVDDCKKFVQRELRRGNKYDGIIMDPPSYGRGPGGEIWKLEDAAFELVSLCGGLLSDNPIFFLLNSYTTGLSASVMQYMLGVSVRDKHGGQFISDEIGLPVKNSGYTLPCGNTSLLWF